MKYWSLDELTAGYCHHITNKAGSQMRPLACPTSVAAVRKAEVTPRPTFQLRSVCSEDFQDKFSSTSTSQWRLVTRVCPVLGSLRTGCLPEGFAV